MTSLLSNPQIRCLNKMKKGMVYTPFDLGEYFQTLNALEKKGFTRNVTDPTRDGQIHDPQNYHQFIRIK